MNDHGNAHKLFDIFTWDAFTSTTGWNYCQMHMGRAPIPKYFNIAKNRINKVDYFA